jgi:mono/diheme cytochrome c family protein
MSRSGSKEVGAAAAVLGMVLLLAGAVDAAGDERLERGAYLFALGGCAGCHTDTANDGPLLAGGRALATPFGTFYGPNITPDRDFGIGAWSDEDFVRALRDGRGTQGSHLYPTFPYPSFTGLRDEDILALKAYIFSLPPVQTESRPHEPRFPFGWRFLLSGWKALNFTPGPFAGDSSRDETWNRGAYLTQAVLHCGECHTPRGWLGAVDRSRAYSGTADGPEGKKVPNITPDKETGIGAWGDAQLEALLKIGFLPDGDVVGSVMGEVVKQSTSKLYEDDRRAVIVYLRSLEAIANPDAKATAPGWE